MRGGPDFDVVAVVTRMRMPADAVRLKEKSGPGCDRPGSSRGRPAYSRATVSLPPPSISDRTRRTNSSPS